MNGKEEVKQAAKDRPSDGERQRKSGKDRKFTMGL